MLRKLRSGEASINGICFSRGSEKGVEEKKEKRKININKYIYYAKEFISKKLIFFCHTVCFIVSTISRSIYVETIFDFAPRVHKHNYGHCGNHLCYALSQSSKIHNFLLKGDILHKTR
jgi:hypothetical protein